MKQTFFYVLFLLLFTAACNLPNTGKTIAMMEQYWKFYKVENYDSLKTFYIPKGDKPDENYRSFSEVLHQLHENYGNVKNVTVTSQTASSSLENGESIDLEYEVEYDKKVISQQFSFRKDNKGVFRILGHSFNQ